MDDADEPREAMEATGGSTAPAVRGETPSSEPSVSAWALAHAAELGGAGHHVPTGKVEVELVTDPWSVWCWGFEPVRRTLEWRFPQVTFRPRVGGMFARLPDPEEVGFDIERFFGVVQRTTGMPIRLDATSRDRPKSTYPACIHAATVRLLRPDLERLYLRKLREAIYFDGLNVSRPEVASKVAQGIGIGADEFVEALASGEPERDFRANLARLEASSIHGYPTILVYFRDKVSRVEGFQSLPGLLSILENVAHRTFMPNPAPAAFDVVAPGERVATREVAEVLGVSMERAFEDLKVLAASGKLTHERHATGDAWLRAE
ncbi:MAG: DsbA family protein [Thermoplasmatota archaeon]